MHSVLKKILETTSDRLDLSTAYREDLEAQVGLLPSPPDFAASLKKPGRRIIAEVKRASPSEGQLRGGIDPGAVARTYEGAGAAAISVLTEPSHFGGSLDDLSRVSSEVTLPCLRKDFIIHEIQVLEARATGASAFLLIVAALTDKQLQRLLALGQALGLSPLVEVHTADELRRAEQAGACIIGVNNRNLNSLALDLRVSRQLRKFIPNDAIAIAESGIHTVADLQILEDSGYNAFLIGSSLMKSHDPGNHLRTLINKPSI